MMGHHPGGDMATANAMARQSAWVAARTAQSDLAQVGARDV